MAQNNKLIKPIEGNEVFVKAGERGTLTAYFNPDEQGEYVIKRMVSYEGKTEELDDLAFSIGKEGVSSSAPNRKKSSDKTILLLGVLFVLVLIFFMLLLIVVIAKKSKQR